MDLSQAPQVATVADLVRARASDPAIGILYDDERWTWAKVVARSEQWAGVLLARRRPGPFHVGILMDNTPDYLLALFGAARAGATTVGINYTHRGEQLALSIRHTDCQIILADQTNIGLLDGLDLGGTQVCLSSDLHQVPTEADGDPLPDVEPSELFCLVFTSGSTGVPKAVQMSHGRAVELADKWSWVAPDDIVYCAIPLFHTNALSAMVLPALRCGCGIALRERFSASRFIPDLRRYGATYFSTAGRALAYVLATPPSPDDRDHRVKFGVAAEASPTDVRAFRHRFGIACFGGYSSSENAITMRPVPGTPKEALGTPVDGADAAVVDPATGEECPPAEFDAAGKLLNGDVAVGEIVGRNVAGRFEGYYNNPAANAERVRNGWYWSGDLGYRDPAGVFYFAGRTNEWLRVDSENFAVAPVERILERYPAARGVAVYAVPDDRTADDQVMAAIELRDEPGFDPAGFATFLSDQSDLGSKWAPRYLRITFLPVGATNKVDKVRLRRERWDTDDPLFWRPGSELVYRAFTPDDRTELVARFAHYGRDISRS